MEQRNNLVLQGTETFSRGQLDNVALDNGSVVLDSVAGRYLQYGSYTTPEFAMPAFCNLNVSWNAHAPQNTMVEVRCRVYAGGSWTGWMSFGKWAPRCGDYVLRDRKDVLRVFVYAPKEWRLAYGKENNMLQAKDEKGIKDEIDKTDRNRAAYYNYYTQNRWGDAHNYDLAINAALGHDACVQMILAATEAKEKAMEG